MLKGMVKFLLKYPLKAGNQVFVSLYYGLKGRRDYQKEDRFGKGKKVLVLSPHVDDETIGLGGTLIKHGRDGDDILCLYITDGSGSDPDNQVADLIDMRKREAEKIAKHIGIKHLVFLDQRDGKVQSDRSTVDKVYHLIKRIQPDIIYTPFLIDGHNDHVETTRTLIKAIKKWDSQYKNIYMYEINCPILPSITNSISLLDKELYQAKRELLKTFESQSMMGFDAFLTLNRGKRFMGHKGTTGVESFVKCDIKEAEGINNALMHRGFNYGQFRQLSSEYNLLISFLKSYGVKKKYTDKIHDIIYQRE